MEGSPSAKTPGRLEFIRALTFVWIANHLPHFPRRLAARRDVILRWAGMDIEGRCQVSGPVAVGGIGAIGCIHVGAGAMINVGVRFGGAQGGISIGRNVLVGPNVSFETVGHGLVYGPGRGRGSDAKPIVVEDEAWIGAGAIVLQGVTIGRGAVVAAGAVVTDDVAAGALVGGVPARVLRQSVSG